MVNRTISAIVLTLAIASILTACSDAAPAKKAKNSAGDGRRTSLLQTSAVQPSAIFDQEKLNNLTNVDLAWGGLVYDKFWVTNPDGTLPAPPATLPAGTAGTVAANDSWPVDNAKKVGADTWRCVACHGWDYAGVDGQFGDPNNPFYTGIRGVITTAGGAPKTLGNPAAIFDVIDTGTLNGEVIPGHSFGQYMPDENALYAITYFVTMMQMEAMEKLDPQTKIANIGSADQLNGYTFYNLYNNKANPSPLDPPGPPVEPAPIGGCAASCHGFDGVSIVIHADKPNDPKDVKAYALKEPFEVLHKVRFGHLTLETSTNAKMPGLEWYPTPEIISAGALNVAVDVLAYAQSGLLPNTIRGGRLYDNWVLETKAEAPAAGTQPIMKIRASDPNLPAILPQEEWLCSSCHGFDYSGGLGFKTNLLAGSLDRGVINGVYTFLSKGRNAWLPTTHERVNVHNFGSLLTGADLWDLDAFLRNGIMDTSNNISRGLNGTALGNAAAGMKFATQGMPDLLVGPKDAMGMEISMVCTSCHGADGKSGTANVDLPHIAWDAPWRFFHRVRFGMPGTFVDATTGEAGRMPGLLELILPSPPGVAFPPSQIDPLGLLTPRATDIQTFAQESYVNTTPPATVSALKAKTAKTLRAGIGQ